MSLASSARSPTLAPGRNSPTSVPAPSRTRPATTRTARPSSRMPTSTSARRRSATTGASWSRSSAAAAACSTRSRAGHRLPDLARRGAGADGAHQGARVAWLSVRGRRRVAGDAGTAQPARLQAPFNLDDFWVVRRNGETPAAADAPSKEMQAEAMVKVRVYRQPSADDTKSSRPPLTATAP